MLTPLYVAVASLAPLAAPPADPGSSTLNTTGVVTFIVSKIVPIILAGIGVILLLSARKQRMSDVFETVMKIVIAFVILGSGTALYKFGGSLVKVFLT